MSSIAKGDIVAYRIPLENNPFPQPTLGRVVLASGDTVRVHVLKTAHYGTPVALDLKPEHVLFNVGRRPGPMMLFGHDLRNLHTRSVEVEDFGTLHWMYNASPEVMSRARAALVSAVKWLTTLRLDNVLDLNIVFEARAPHGKYAGAYRGTKDLEENPGVLWFSPESKYATDNQPVDYILAHELAHVIGIHLVEPHAKCWSDWVDLYQRTVRAEPLIDQACDVIFEYLDQATDFKAWRSACLEDDVNALAFKQVIAYWRRVTRITAMELDTLIRAGRFESIRKRRPTSSRLTSTKMEPLISDYACKSPRELFAEAVAYQRVGKKLPGNVIDLIDESMRLARGTLRSLR